MNLSHSYISSCVNCWFYFSVMDIVLMSDLHILSAIFIHLFNSLIRVNMNLDSMIHKIIQDDFTYNLHICDHVYFMLFLFCLIFFFAVPSGN